MDEKQPTTARPNQRGSNMDHMLPPEKPKKDSAPHLLDPKPSEKITLTFPVGRLPEIMRPSIAVTDTSIDDVKRACPTGVTYESGGHVAGLAELGRTGAAGKPGHAIHTPHPAPTRPKEEP